MELRFMNWDKSNVENCYGGLGVLEFSSPPAPPNTSRVISGICRRKAIFDRIKSWKLWRLRYVALQCICVRVVIHYVGGWNVFNVFVLEDSLRPVSAYLYVRALYVCL